MTRKPKKITAKILRLGDQAERRISGGFLGAIRSTTSRASRQKLYSALRRKDFDAAMRAVPWETIGDSVLTRRMKLDTVRAYIQAGGIASEAVSAKRPYEVVSSAARDWFNNHGARRVTEMSRQAKDGLRRVLVAASDRGLNLEQTVKFVLPQVGLRSDQVDVLAAYRDRLAAAEDPRLDERVAKRAIELRKDRARVIARTESMFAIHGGVRETWAGLLAEGVLKDEDAVEWFTAEDEVTCDICRPMDGQTRGLTDDVWIDADGQTLTDSRGETILDPPAHPNCRCTTELKMGDG